MKRFIKNIGRVFIVLAKINEYEVKQTVLLVDGSFILPNNFAFIIKAVKEKFKNAKITVLTFKYKEGFIKDNFQDVEVIVPANGLIKRYQLAIKLFFLLRRNYTYIILSSLDVSLLLVTMLFARRPVFLHNRWFEWYRVRYRTFLDILFGTKSADKNRRKVNRSFQDILKSFGRYFVILSPFDEEAIMQPVLIIDDGKGELGYITTAVRRVLLVFINPAVNVLTFTDRKHYFTGMAPNIKVFIVKDVSSRFSLARELWHMRKHRFSSIVLTDLDITPILVSFLFMHGTIFLYNRWHEWWSLSYRNIGSYIRGIFSCVYNVIISIYLLAVSGYILLRMALRSLKYFSRVNE